MQGRRNELKPRSCDHGRHRRRRSGDRGATAPRLEVIRANLKMKIFFIF